MVSATNSQDSDPVIFSGPWCMDDSFSGSKVHPTTGLGQRVTSVLSDEMLLWDITDRGPSPVAYACTNVVDEKTPKIRYVYCRSLICSCQMSRW